MRLAAVDKNPTGAFYIRLRFEPTMYIYWMANELVLII